MIGSLRHGLRSVAALGLPRWLATFAAVVGVLLVLMLVAGAPLGTAAAGFLDGAFGGRRFAYLMATLSRATLIVGMAVSALLSLRAGLFNIGGEGQLVAGGLVSALVALALPGPPLVVLAAAIAAGMAAGAGWAVLAGVLELRAGVPLLVGSLLLNFPIRSLASYLVAHPFRDVPSGMVQSPLVPQATWLPLLPGVRLDIGVLVIVLVAVAAVVYAGRTVHGYHARLHGLAPEFARATGLPVAALTLQTLALSGAVAGLCGALAVFGIHHRYVDGMLVQPLYAWTGIMAVLLVGAVPWRVPFAGLLFAALETGAAGMERATQVPKEIAVVMQAVIILLCAGRAVAGTGTLAPPDEGGGDG